MARTLVTNTEHDTRVPFLRGILTRSLEHAGLPFDTAYNLASTVREKLSGRREITTDDLRALVADLIRKDHGDITAMRYLSVAPPEEALLVTSGGGQTAPFSRTSHQRSLHSCGLTAEAARPVTAKIYEHLLARGTTHITSDRLGYLTYRYLKRDVGPRQAQRYLVWAQFIRSGRPLILLIGGSVGCGKSTIATEVAHHLEIVRIQSTDMLREVMRLMLPQRVTPALHTSSFLAWQCRPGNEAGTTPEEEHVIDGFRSQAELLAMSCEAVVSRAVRERVSLIVEGVHIEPGMAARLPRDTDAIVVEALMAVLKPKTLRKRLRGRGKAEPARRADRYLKSFDAIWTIQTHLLKEADQHGVPIIPNNDKSDAAGDLMVKIIDKLALEFTASAREVFPDGGKRPASRH
ncbi:MAG: hypothetical protein AAFN78_00285 [Pseudomonadota bacterium]